MNNLNIFCFGFGQVAKCFIKKLRLKKFNINLSTTSRKNTRKKKFDEIDYTSFMFDGTNYDNKLIEKLKKSDHILVSIPPRDGTDLVLKSFFITEKFFFFSVSRLTNFLQTFRSRKSQKQHFFAQLTL